MAFTIGNTGNPGATGTLGPMPERITELPVGAQSVLEFAKEPTTWAASDSNVDTHNVKFPTIPDPKDSTLSVEPPVDKPHVGDPSDVGKSDQPGPIQDGQGHVFYPRVDPKTGDTLYEHHSESDLPNNGGHAALDITLALHRDGTFDRTVHQHIKNAATTEVQDGVTKTKFDVAGVTTGETSDVHLETPPKKVTDPRTITDEHTESTYAAGKETHRDTNLTKIQTVSDVTGASAESTQKIHAVWDKAGAPIDDATKPTIQLDETTKYTQPKQGLYHDTPRTITTHRLATGTSDALTWVDPMTLVVRWEGHGNEFMQRDIEYPMDAQGNPIEARATVTKTTDGQSAFHKAEMKTRIWGGFVSSIMGIVGANMMAFPSTRGIGKALLWGGVGLGALNTLAGVHALTSKRTDGDVASTVMAGYDTLWLGLLAGASRGNGLLGGLAKASASQKATVMGGSTALGIGAAAFTLNNRPDDAGAWADKHFSLPKNAGREFGTTNRLDAETIKLLG